MTLVSTQPAAIEELGLSREALFALPGAVRRQVARYLLRWSRGEEALALLPEHDVTPRDRFDRCCALVAAAEFDRARDVARELVNEPEAGGWGNRAVGEVFLALGKAERADERFRAGGDVVGRARAHLLLGQYQRALDLLRDAGPEDPEAEVTRLEALTQLGQDFREVERHLADLYADDTAELRETMGAPEAGSEVFSGELPQDAETLTAALQRVFQYDAFRPGQVEVILPLLRGESVLGLMPTGAGKSICFQLPAALLPGATVVISPLIALMKDQVDGLPAFLYRRATLINSALELGEADRRMDAIANGEVSLIYAAPERLRQRSFVRALQRRGVSLFVIDEAHCVSLWGHDFRPDYFFIRQVLKDLGSPTVLALTATATPEMQEDIGRQLDTKLHHVNLGTFRPNLRLSVHRMSGDADKWAMLQTLVKEEKGPTIVYVDRRRLTEDLAARLSQQGVPAQSYHAGMDRDARDRAQTRFMKGEVRVMVATVAFGMGVDKADVRLVVHYSLPRSLEAYYQEAGRAGRDGLPARCVLLYSSHDKSGLTRRSNGDRAQSSEIMLLHRALQRHLSGGCVPVPIEAIEKECGSEGTRVRVGVSLLEGIGALERGYDLPGTIWLASGLRRDWSRGAPDDRFTNFAASVGLPPRGGASVPAQQVASAAGVSLDCVEALLLDWQEAGWVKFRCGARGMGVRVSSARQIERDVAQVLGQVAEMDHRRLDLLNRYLLAEECRQGFVSRYFGAVEPVGCEVCDNCLAGDRRPTASRVAERSAARDYAVGPHSDEESALFELLRAWRRERAREEGVAAYKIFHDRVLYEVARSRPKTLPALAEIPGVGRSKLQAFGDEILEIVRQAS